MYHKLLSTKVRSINKKVFQPVSNSFLLDHSLLTNLTENVTDCIFVVSPSQVVVIFIILVVAVLLVYLVALLVLDPTMLRGESQMQQLQEEVCMYDSKGQFNNLCGQIMQCVQNQKNFNNSSFLAGSTEHHLIVLKQRIGLQS